MIIFFGIYLLVIIIDYRNLIKREDKKQIIIYSCMTTLTIIVAILYYRDTLGQSLLELFGKIFY